MKKIKEWFLNNFVSIIGLLSPILSGVAVGIWKSMKETLSYLDWVLIGIMAAESIFIIIFSIWRMVSYKSYHYSASKISTDYITIRKVINYKLVNQNNSTYLDHSCLRKIKCCVDHLDSIPAKYIWTGDSTPTFNVNTQGVALKPTTRKKGIWTFYNIVFNNSILKGCETDVDIVFDPIHDYSTSEPFVSTSTEEPNKEIKFVIDLGMNYANKTAKFEIFRANESYYPLKDQDLHFDQYGRLEHNVPFPKRFRRYVISWDW